MLQPVLLQEEYNAVPDEARVLIETRARLNIGGCRRIDAGV
jgi:hypothetical protein